MQQKVLLWLPGPGSCLPCDAESRCWGRARWSTAVASLCARSLAAVAGCLERGSLTNVLFLSPGSSLMQLLLDHLIFI